MKPACGFSRRCCFDRPSVNWPKERRVGAQAINVESIVTWGIPSGVTVASSPILSAGWVRRMSSSLKDVSGCKA